jgi:hypothetical protein
MASGRGCSCNPGMAQNNDPKAQKAPREEEKPLLITSHSDCPLLIQLQVDFSQFSQLRKICFLSAGTGSQVTFEKY